MKRTITIFCSCLLLTGCTASAPGTEPHNAGGLESTAVSESETAPPQAKSLTPDNLTDLLVITNARRQAIVKPEPDTGIVSGWNSGEVEPGFDLSSAVLDFQPSFSASDTYTLEQAQADLDYLFYFYEIGYGPYFQFGGPDAFDDAKRAILADLKHMDSIAAPDFEASLRKHLSFVKDAHFVINQETNYPLLRGYLSEQTFLKDSLGFTGTLSGKRVRSIDGREDFADAMVLSVTPEGDINYRYCVIARAEEKPDSSELSYEDGTVQTTSLFSAHEAAGQPPEHDGPVSLSRIDGIPVISVAAMGFPHANDDWDANKFLDLARELQDEPVLIIDLRRNGGGNGFLPQMWFEAYTGTYLTPNHYNLFRLDLYHAFGMERSAPDPDSFYYVPADVAEYYAKPQTINESWELENAEPRQVVENDRLLIVLTSKGTASAADNFTDITFNVRNTLVIGSNTTGMFTSAAAIGAKMPNSGMVGQMGFNLSVFDEEHFQEGRGLMPDLWASGDALEAALVLAGQFIAQ